MKIEKNYSIDFGNKIETAKLFEAMIDKNFISENIGAYKTMYDSFETKKKFVGNIGYRGYFKKYLLERITKKYPNLSEDRKSILKLISEKENITKSEIAGIVKPYIEKYGENIDIII